MLTLRYLRVELHMAECDGNGAFLQFAVALGLCGGICRIPFGLRRIAMDFLRNCGAEQKEVKPLRSYCQTV